MKNVLVLGVAALALVGCGKKEEAPAPAEAPAAEAAAPAAEAAPQPEAPVDSGGVVVSKTGKELPK